MTAARRGMVDRLNESRQRGVTERNGRGDAPEFRPQGPAASGGAARPNPGISGGDQSRTGLRDRMASSRNQAMGRPERPSSNASPVIAARQQAEQTAARHRDLNARLTDYRQRRDPAAADPSSPRRDFGRDSRGGIDRPASHVHARYYDRPDLIRHDYRHAYTYYDRYYRLHHRIIWPDYHYPIYYRFGPRPYFRYVYPYYHRKYVFISLGGFWPDDYFYIRYYWYGWHPYVWYGYYPVAREVVADNYNYYTYNYYYQDTDGSYANYTSNVPVNNDVPPVDQSTWADVRQKLDQRQARGPAAQTVADTRFEEGVKSFEGGDYGGAAAKFQEAMRLSPEDMILPFAYAQALFADGRYTESAEMLRKALSKVTPEKEGVFYPRGLYANDDVLYAQIEKLVDKMEQFENDADMQLLLGYHLLGTGETGYAREPLERASHDMQNSVAAKTLLKLADKIESEAKAADQAEGASKESGAAPESQASVETEAAAPSPTQTAPERAEPAGPGVSPVESIQPRTQNPNQVPDVNGPSPMAEGVEDPNAAAVAPPGGAGLGGGESDPAQSASMAEAGNWFGQGISALARCLRLDFAVLVGIVLLGSVGVYVQWRLPCRG
ncbi:MAG: hypothetical protein GX448_17840 [Planctomycetes bacterium]|nr:hypothetical protein [Planctomycetota bacterium]